MPLLASTCSATAQWYSVRCHCRVSESFLWCVICPLALSGAPLVPPPASRGEERRMCAFPLNCHTTSGSFQRDSAGAGHSCHRFRLHDGRASYSSQCLDAPAIWCSVFPQSAPWPLEQASFSARKGQCFAAWRVRPSGPDSWAGSAVRRMYTGKRRG